MFMIVSEEGRNLIAIGDRLLKVWGMADVFDAAQAYESGRIKFNRKQKTVQLGEGRKLKCQVSEIFSVVGKLSLCIVKIPACGEEELDLEPPKSEKEKIETKEVTQDLAKASLVENQDFSLDDFIKDEEDEIKKEETAKVDIDTKIDDKESLLNEKIELSDELKLEEEPKLDEDIKQPTALLQEIEEESKEEKKEAKSTQEESKKVVTDNADALDIDSLLMDDDVSNTLVVDESKNTLLPQEPTPQKEQKESIEIEDIFEEIAPEAKMDDETFDLDTLLDEKEPTKKEEKNKEESIKTKKDDELDLDELFDDEGLEDKDEDLSLDSLLEEPEISKDKTKDEKDELDLDSLLDIDNKAQTESKKDENKDEDLDLDLLLDDISDKKESKKEPIEDDFNLDDLFGDEETPKTTKESKTIEEDLDLDDFNLDNLFEDESKDESSPKKEVKTPEIEPTPVNVQESGLLSIKDDNTISKELQDAPKKSDSFKWRELVEGFNIDLAKNAEKMEFSQKEYEDLIESFIKDSKDMENTLRFGDKKEQLSAITTLSDAITLLHLSPLDKLLQEVTKSDKNDINSVIDAFYRILDDIEEDIQKARDKREFGTNQPIPKDEPNTEKTIQESISTESEKKEEKVSNNSTTTEIVSVDEFLKDVKIVPIEFSIKIAADELNLPEDLVLEFVNDFSNQGHEYIPELIDAYQKGDLDRLQKTAHMLKGAASNLRIEPMVQNLYDLQFDNDISRAPERIKLFAGQLMSLDQYLKQLNNN